jgi:protein gp37
MSPATSVPCVHYSFNPWWGCTKLSAGCDHCYAEVIDARAGGNHWGPDAPRRTFGEKYWARPLKWDAAEAASGTRARVLCASMADVFDANAPVGELQRLWALIRRTPSLDWLLLTRRPGRIPRNLPPDWGDGYPNVWLGVSVEDSETARQRVPVLVAIPARLRFVCYEPILGPVDLRPWTDGLHWVIAGGETGPHARPLHPDWALGLRDQCVEAGIPLYFKAWGAGRAGSRLGGRTWHQLPHPPAVPASRYDASSPDSSESEPPSSSASDSP